ncbi:Polypyrimidine tract-binding protein-like protein 1 [Bienertia sinuspersici]
MSTSGQQQFRYTQTPSKVLHLRNLPWECSEEELIELCKPFGKIVNTKCNVGANRNQAFVEYSDLNQAISMVSYYASSSEPAQVRGKTVYIQYSNRHEIVNNKSPGDIPGNVLLVTMEGVQPGDVTIEVIHLAHSDKSRDYTIPDTGMIAAQQPSNYPGAPAAPWMNPQTGAGYPSNGYGSGYVAGVTMPPQSHAAPAPSWDPSMQPGRQTFVSVPSTFPGQTSPIPPAYASAPISPSPGGSMPMAPSAGSRPYYP